MKKSLWLLSFLLCPSLMADFRPPEWRDLPGTTYQKWDFSTSEPLPVAEEYNNAFGAPNVTNIVDGTWIAQRDSREGVWNANSLFFLIPNDNASALTKYRIEIIWNVQATTSPDLDFFVGENTSSSIAMDIIENSYVPNSNWWKCTIFETTVPTFPSAPMIYFEAKFAHIGTITPVYIDEITIDIMAIPEPATMLLLGLGLLIRRKTL